MDGMTCVVCKHPVTAIVEYDGDAMPEMSYEHDDMGIDANHKPMPAADPVRVFLIGLAQQFIADEAAGGGHLAEILINAMDAYDIEILNPV